jgi:4-amino-4-deoxy-L-arabinose transferase-like glycosyltransferase
MTVANAFDEAPVEDTSAGAQLVENNSIGDRTNAQGSRWSVRLPELGIFAYALITNLWALSNNGLGNTYYAAAIRSMTTSWKSFAFASFDPGAWITVDKPPLGFWAPALLARVFGYSSWTILIPGAVAGALAVWLLAITVRRVWGRAAGLVAGAALATMPTMVAVSRSNMPDVYLVLGVVAAVWALERAVATKKSHWMIAMGAFIGLAFLAKLGAALIAVPALWFAYFVAAPVTWKLRVKHLLIATAAMAAVAFVWIGAVAMIPSSSRPFIGGSTDGTAWDLVVGYNGLGRVTGNSTNGGPGGFPGGGPGGGFPGGGSGGVNSFGGTTGVGRLFNAGMGDQVMWLTPLVLGTLLGATWLFARRRLSRAEVVSLGAFSGWAVTSFVTFSYASGIYHNYYVSLLAPALAAIVGIGTALVLRFTWRARALATLAVGSTAGLQLVFMRRIDSLTALRVVAPAAMVIGGIALLTTLRSRARRVTLGAIGIAAASILVAPMAWSLSSLVHASSGSFPEARPKSLETDPLSGPGGGSGGFLGRSGLDDDTTTWLESQRTTETWIVAVASANTASDAVIKGHSVMAYGGFMGSDPSLSQTRLAELVREGKLRFVMTGGGFGGFQGGSTAATVASSVCTVVPAANWGGTGNSSIYDCGGKADAIVGATPSASTATPATTPSSGQAPAGLPGGTGGGVDFAKIQKCLADKGIAPPAPGAGQTQPDAATITALQECGFAPPGGIGAPTS